MFGDELKNARKALLINGKAFTQERLADIFYDLAEASCSRQTVGYWENGINKPTMDNAILLSVILNIPLDKLFYEEIRDMRDKYHEYLTKKIQVHNEGDNAMKKCKMCGKEHNEIDTERLVNLEFGDHAYDSCRTIGNLCEICSSAILSKEFDYNLTEFQDKID
ncbi:MAG: helix-turn-helix transcriptional regulator [Eubacterium sp.]|nr:helix-turn-helix transcriptional regulator [Eubacterium sp.]